MHCPTGDGDGAGVGAGSGVGAGLGGGVGEGPPHCVLQSSIHCAKEAVGH